MLYTFVDYYKKAKMMQELKFQGKNWTEKDVNDDLVWYVPIYDVVNRRFAAFSSLLEAIKRGVKDPKGNGKYFKLANESISDEDFIKLCYLFRLCGSGINYKPKTKGESPFGTHGFGNFWVVNELSSGSFIFKDWIKAMPEKKFCDVKGYLLPMIKGGLNMFIRNESEQFIEYLIKNIKLPTQNKMGIKDLVDKGNEFLIKKGHKRQNFVLTAFAMDIAEYFPNLVDRSSDVYVGSNAKRCLDLILPKIKKDEALRILCDITGNHSMPYDMEDVACDFIRYINNFQSEHHIAMNNGVIYENNFKKK